MSSFFRGPWDGDADLARLPALLDARLEPPDPLFDAFAFEPPLRGGRNRGGGGSGGAPLQPARPPPREPAAPIRRARRTRLPRASLVLAACCAAAPLQGCGDEETAPPPRAPEAVLVQLRGSDVALELPEPGRPGPPIVPLESIGPEGEPLLLRVPVPPGRGPEGFAAELAAQAQVRFAEPIYLYQPQVLATREPSDPRARGQWGLRRIGAQAAWARSTGGPGAAVAILDDDADLAHADLAPNLWSAPAAASADREAGIRRADFAEGEAAEAAAGFFHGARVAGVIGAAGDNGEGIAGVSWNATLMPVRALRPRGGRSDELVRAIDFASEHGARIVVAAWSGAGRSLALEQAVERALRRGVLFAAAAGNEGASRPSFPASLDLENVLSVSAVAPDGALAPFADRGALLAAPGVGILSTAAPGAYERSDGTSLAAAHVAGAAALLWSAHPEASLDRLRAALLASAAPLEGVRQGALDVARAMDWLEEQEEPEDPGKLLLSREAMGFEAAPGFPPRSRGATVSVEGGAARPWTARADVPWLSASASGTTPSRLVVHVDPAAAPPGVWEGHVLVRTADPGPTAVARLSVALRVGGERRARAEGPACGMRGAIAVVRRGTVCRLLAPGFEEGAAAPAVRWSLPGGGSARGAGLVALFVERGDFALRVGASEGSPDAVRVRVE